MKATEQYFPAVVFIMVHKVVLSFETVNYSGCLFGKKKHLCNILAIIKRINARELFTEIIY